MTNSRALLSGMLYTRNRCKNVIFSCIQLVSNLNGTKLVGGGVVVASWPQLWIPWQHTIPSRSLLFIQTKAILNINFIWTRVQGPKFLNIFARNDICEYSKENLVFLLLSFNPISWSIFARSQYVPTLSVSSIKRYSCSFRIQLGLNANPVYELIMYEIPNRILNSDRFCL